LASFLDQVPFPFSDPAARDLWDLLSANYQNKAAVRDMLTRVDFDTSEVNWDVPMRWVWESILTLTHRQAKLQRLLQLIMDGDDRAVATRIRELVAASPVSSAPQPDSGATNWKGFSDSTDERIIWSESTLLDIAFLRRGVELAEAVCRLLVTFEGRKCFGTAFRITENLLLTNHHVLFDRDHRNAPAETIEAWFGYERTFSGLQLSHTIVRCDPARIVGNSGHDWAVVNVSDPIPTNVPIIETSEANPVRVDDRVYIIQHPGGAPKKIGMIHNIVRHVDEDVIQYLTDTDRGSSGSPVFNEQWQLVALHHSWVKNRVGENREYRNQGRRIERVLEDMRAAGVT
jgi:V8-like Glu-specific endopeptidase